MKILRILIIKVASYLGLVLMEQWVIIEGGFCMPASEVSQSRNPQLVSFEWIEASRRAWARLAEFRRIS